MNEYKPTRLRLASLLLHYWSTGDWTHEEDEDWTPEEGEWIRENEPRLIQLASWLPRAIGEWQPVRWLAE